VGVLPPEGKQRRWRVSVPLEELLGLFLRAVKVMLGRDAAEVAAVVVIVVVVVVIAKPTS